MSQFLRPTRRLLRAFAVVLVLILLANEVRFVLFGPFGYPQRPPLPNFGEVRRQLDSRIGSEEEFVAFLRERSGDLSFSFVVDGRGRLRLDGYKTVSPVGEIDTIAEAPVDWDRVRAAVQTRWNGSLLFPQKIYSLSYKRVECQDVTVEISQSGAASDWGSCGK